MFFSHMFKEMTNNTSTVKLLSPRVLELAPVDGDSDMYTLVRPEFQGFGTEEWTLRSYYEEALADHRHAMVRIAGQDGGFLGLVPKDPKLSVYVEIDDLANPIRV